MTTSQKTIELQHNIKQNSEEFRNQLNDLYNWEKEIKGRERQLKQTSIANYITDVGASGDYLTRPVRSHISTENLNTCDKRKSSKLQQLPSKAVITEATTKPAGKFDAPGDAVNQSHKTANDFKDRGNNFVRSERYTEAIEMYTAAINTFTDDPIYYSNRALCYLKMQSYDKCIKDCNMALNLDKLFIKAYYRRMLAYESLGNDLYALKDCNAVLTIDPKNAETKRSMQRIKERLLKHEAADGPCFSPDRPDLIDVDVYDLPAHKRSNKPLNRVAIIDIIGPKLKKDSKQDALHISDEDIDKIFNSNCGPFEQIVEPTYSSPIINANTIPGKTLATVNGSKLLGNIDMISVKQEKQLKNNQQQQQHNNSVKKTRPLPPAPTSTAQFYTNWKELEPEQKYKYLKSIRINQLCKLLGAGFDSDTLASLLKILHDYFLPNKDLSTVPILAEISKNKQTTILSMLMSSEEVAILNTIMEGIKTLPNYDCTIAKEICNNFSLKIFF